MSTYHDRLVANISRLMEEQGLTYDKLAHRMNFDNGSAVFKKFFYGHHFIDDQIESAAFALGVSIDELNKEPLIEREAAMNFDPVNFYTYKNLRLDPKTCAIRTDKKLHVDGIDIKDVITEYYDICFKEYGPLQLWIIRYLDGTVSLGISEQLVDRKTQPETLMFLNKKAAPSVEENLVRTTVNFIKKFKIEITGIFIEETPGTWAIIHDGLQADDKGTLADIIGSFIELDE